MAIKVPGEKPASETGTLLTNGMTVHPRWYEYKRNPPPAPTIDWQFYKSLFDMELWQALALSCGIIPDYPNEGQDAEYDRRMVIALNHMQPGALLADIKRGDRPHLTRVKLADVARLAAALDWSLPDAFPNPQPTESAPMAAKAIEARDSANIVHSTKNKKRDSISPAIEQAQSKCNDKFDVAEVWGWLQKMARERHPPFVGVTEEGLQVIERDGYFKRDDLRKRLERQTAR